MSVLHAVVSWLTGDLSSEERRFGQTGLALFHNRILYTISTLEGPQGHGSIMLAGRDIVDRGTKGD